MERQRDERLEAAGLVLQLAQPDQVVDAVIGVFDVAVEHRGVGAQAQLVGRAMDVEPVAGVGLVLADLVADLGMEDLGAAAGQAAQAGVDHLLEDRRGPTCLVRSSNQLISTAGPGLEVQPRIGLVQDADDVHVPVVLHLVVQAADDVHLGAAVVDRFLPASQDLLVAHHVALGVAQVGAERAERAAIDADVGRVQVRVDVVVREVAVLPLADDVGELADFVERSGGVVEQQPVLEASRSPARTFSRMEEREGVDMARGEDGG